MINCCPSFKVGPDFDLLDLFQGCLALVSPKGNLVRCNSAFLDLLNRGDTLACDEQSLICFQATSAQEAFREALTKRAPTAFFTHTAENEQLLITLSAPKRRERQSDGGSASPDPVEAGPWVMWIRQNQHDRISVEFLRHQFGLTPAEVRITEYVVQGLTIEEGAAQIGISKITARNQLTSAMSKLGVNRQSQLVALIYSMVPSLKP